MFGEKRESIMTNHIEINCEILPFCIDVSKKIFFVYVSAIMSAPYVGFVKDHERDRN